MSDLNIGSTILKLRKEKNITQERLATMVGVSAGAVSKWENGNSTPDIALLAPLARVLNTSLEILLSFHQEISKTQILHIKTLLTDKFAKGNYIEAEEQGRRYLLEYPNSIDLKLTIATLIQMYSPLDGADEEAVTDRLKYAKELLREVVESRDSKFMSVALFSIASIEIMMKNYEEAEEALREISNGFIDPTVLYASLYEIQGKTKEGQGFCKRMLLQSLNQSTAILAILSRLSIQEKDYHKAALFLDGINDIQNTFKIGLGMGAYSYSKLCMEMGQKDIAAQWFKKYIDTLIGQGYDYCDNPYFKGLQLEMNLDAQKAIRKKLLQQLIEEEDFKELVKYDDYKEAIDKLKDEILTLEKYF